MLDICNVNSNAVMYYGFAMEKRYYRVKDPNFDRALTSITH